MYQTKKNVLRTLFITSLSSSKSSPSTLPRQKISLSQKRIFPWDSTLKFLKSRHRKQDIGKVENYAGEYSVTKPWQYRRSKQSMPLGLRRK